MSAEPPTSTTTHHSEVTTNYWIVRHLQSADSRIVAYIVTTALAAVFNMVVFLVICFWVMPGISASIQGDARNRELIEENHRLLHINTETLVRHQKILEGTEPELRAARREIDRLNKEISGLKLEVIRLRAALLDTKKPR